jgi:NADPH:quinone reductase-like Zn-dependent oxidoreductase
MVPVTLPLMQAVRFHGFGGVETLRVDEVPIPEPGEQELLIRVTRCGVNRIDILSRQGLTPTPVPVPHISGSEIAGEVASLGTGVRGFAEGDRVVVVPTLSCGQCPACLEGRDNVCRYGRVFGVHTEGGYAEYVTAPAGHVLPLPDGVSAEAAASVTVAGTTAWHMLVTRGRITVGETVLILAAGSGIGVLGIQIAKLAGARVIATAGSQRKLDRALELGADAVVNHREENWSQRVRELTHGQGVDLVFEHVGQATWNQSLRSMAWGGRLVTCGGHSGFTVTLDLWQLFAKEQILMGSFTGTRRDLQHVLGLVASGDLVPVIHGVYPLADASRAQQAMEDQAAFGKLILQPGSVI